MKKAIITGALGLVGMSVAKYFSSKGVDILCLGRSALNPEDIGRNFGPRSRYIMLQMEDICLLPGKIDLIGWSPGVECVFFNFAWCGHEKLADGTFGEQINNAIYAAHAVHTAKKLGCIKFVNAGTLEETFLENILAGKSNQPNPSTQSNYALAKLASRDMSKMIAYLEKIDYVHTRLSIPLVPDLSRGTYVAATLKKIAEGQSYDVPTNNQLFDIITIDDLARAYFLIGLNGKNKADYYIGSGRPATLSQYFERFARLVNGSCSDETTVEVIDDTLIFSSRDLYKDTGFVSSTQFEKIAEMVRKS